MSNLTRAQKIFMHFQSLQKFIQEPENIELKETDIDAYNEKMETKYKQLYDKYHSLYKMASSRIFNENDYNILKMMLSKIEKIDKNDMTEEIASKEIGQNLYDKYVSHLVDEEKEKGK
jgi:hypothetical protein